MERKKRTIEGRGGGGGGGGKRSLVGQLKAVQTVEFQETVLRICSSRGDSWARDVKGKIEFFARLCCP